MTVIYVDKRALKARNILATDISTTDQVTLILRGDTSIGYQYVPLKAQRASKKLRGARAVLHK